jgi:hypothetical protein
MENIKCYAVIGGWNYEGESFDSLRLFDRLSEATAYAKVLTEVEGYDYFLLNAKEVEA